MNQFFVKHWQRRYRLISQCSKGHPFRRQVKSGEVKFTDPNELLEYLQFNKEADFMWSDSEDLAIIADMFQINIKVITTKGPQDENPTVNWIYADESLKEFAELKNVEMDDMVLLHENDIHFNLIISKESDLAQFGSLSYRFNFSLGENSKKEDETNEKTEITREEELEKVKLELKECKMSKEYIENEYYKCEKMLREKTEDAEKIKIENKDLKKIIELRNELKDKKINDVPFNDNEEDEARSLINMKNKGFTRKSPHTESIPRRHTLKEKEIIKDFKCDKCSFVGSNQMYLANHTSSKHRENEYNCEECAYQGLSELHVRKHMNMNHPPRGVNKKHEENEYNCKECDFQGSSEMQVRKHVNLKHTPKGRDTTGTIKCRICEQEFSEKWNLMRHRKTNHKDSVAFCRNFEDNNCSFTSESCWWNHEKSSGSDSVKCFICGTTFATKNEMMVHRKKIHLNVIKSCTQFLLNGCRFQDNFCWFKHDSETENTNVEESIMETESDFQEVHKNRKPPSEAENHIRRE